MTRKLLLLLAIVVVLSLMIAVPVSAKKPLTGDMDLSRVGVPCDTGVFTWGGTVTFGSDAYPMAFIKLGTGKPFDSPPPPDSFPPGNVSFFGEQWAIYPPDFVLLTDSCPSAEDDALIWGYDSGVVTFDSFHKVTYRMNGDVAEAYGDFAIWEGRKVHMSGEIVPGVPFTAPGTFRLN
jgi:hypothetical protein